MTGGKNIPPSPVYEQKSRARHNGGSRTRKAAKAGGGEAGQRYRPLIPQRRNAAFVEGTAGDIGKFPRHGHDSPGPGCVVHREKDDGPQKNAGDNGQQYSFHVVLLLARFTPR
jgi:hypothetical protein